MKKTLWVMLPCYNEEKNIVALVEKWQLEKEKLYTKGYTLKVVGIDDKSTDNTNALLKELSGKHDNVTLLEHEVNKNLGGVLDTVFNYFIENGNENDLCTLMDGDNTHEPKYIISMLDEIEKGADCVIASRYCRNSRVIGVPNNRLFLSDAARVYYKIMLNVKNVEDYTCGYRTYTYNIIKKAKNVYGEDFVERKTFACMMEVLYKLNQIGAKFSEVPFELRYDYKQGDSKMRIVKTVKDSLVTAFELKVKVHKKKEIV